MAPAPRSETPIETVERLATLARLAIPAEKKEALSAEFEGVIAYIAQLDGLELSLSDTPSVPPVHNVFREDGNAYEPGIWTREIVKAFPAKSGNSLSVKKILSHD